MNSVVEFIKQYIQPLFLPIIVLVVAWFVAPYGNLIPESFTGIWETGPYLIMVALAALGIAYNRGRAILIALLMTLAILLQTEARWLSVWLQPGDLSRFVLTVLVPVNLAIIGWYKERGVFTFFGFVRLGFIFAQLFVVAGIAHFRPEMLATLVHGLQMEWLYPETLQPVRVTPVALLLMLASGLSLLLSAFLQRLHVTFGLFAGMCGLSLALYYADGDNLFHTSSIAIGLILCIAILRDSYNMAYRDELTGLPQRRALNELFMSLGGDYTVAMMDVDHFKKFNDKHGHDVGDQVLKMVAAQIGKVKDGGRAFRYGGEEFTIVYPSKVKEQTLRSLEEVRETIESYELVIRSSGRIKKNEEEAKAKRGKGAEPGAKRVSVTISIGVADRTDRFESPDEVLKKADKALYQAKEAGRNQLVAFGSQPEKKKKKKK